MHEGHGGMTEQQEAIANAVRATVAELGIDAVRQMSMFPSAKCNREGYVDITGDGGS